MAQQPVEELAAAVLAASTCAGQLLISEGAEFEAARVAYKRLALALHPDKNAGLPLAAEAFKMVTSAFNQLQTLHERRRSGAQLAAQPAEPEGHSRWEAFTGRAGAQKAQQQPHQATAAAGDPGQPPAAAAAAGAAGTAKPNNRWGRPSTDYGKLFKPSSLAPPGRAASQQGQQRTDTQQENDLPVASPRAGPDPKPSGAGRGVAPSAFYAGGSSCRSWPEQQPPLQQQTSSLYSLWGAQAPFSLSQPGSGGSHPRTTAAAAPAPRSSLREQQQQQMQPSAAAARPSEGGSKWGSSKPAVLDLLRVRPMQPAFPALNSKGPETTGAAEPKWRSGAGGGAGKRVRQQQAQLLESSDSEEAACSSNPSGSASLESEPSIGGNAHELSSSGGISEPNDVPATAGLSDPAEVQQQQQAPGEDSAVSQLEAAVQQRQAGALLMAQGLGAAVIQAGRKLALERHYERRGSRQQKRAGSGKRGASGTLAKLQLVAVGSKRVRE